MAEREMKAGIGEWMLITAFALGFALVPVFVIGGAAVVLITEDFNGLLFAAFATLWLLLLALVPVGLATGAVCWLHVRDRTPGLFLLIIAGLAIGLGFAAGVVGTDGMTLGCGAVCGALGGVGTWYGGRDAMLW